MKSFEYRGLWWPAGGEPRKETGILSYSDEEGIRLNVIGTFVVDDYGRPSLDDTIEMIYGVTVEGKLITLQDCMPFRTNDPYPGIPTQEFRCELAYIGAYHLLSGKRDVKVTNWIRFSLNNLLGWLNITGLAHEYNTDEGSNIQGTSISFTLPDPIEIPLPNAAISVHLLAEAESSHDRSTLRQYPVIQITAENPLCLDDWLFQFVKPIQDLLTLATGHANSITDLNVFVSKSMVNVEPDQPYHEGRSFQVIFQPVFHDSSEVKFIHPEDKVFFYTDVKEQVGDLFRRWLALQNDPQKETLRTVCSLLLNTTYHRNKMFLETQFLNIAQSAELYHRTQFNETLLSKKEFSEFREAVLKCVPDNCRDWFKEQIRFSNEATLAQRLTRLFKLSEDVMSLLFADGDLFVQKVKNTRNFFTHFSPDVKAKAATDEELFILTQSLSFMMLRLLLMELGFSSEQCVKIFTNNRTFQYLQGRVKRIYKVVPNANTQV